MSAKIFITLALLIALLAVSATAQVNQGISQSASNVAKGQFNRTNVTQTNVQNAAQNAAVNAPSRNVTQAAAMNVPVRNATRGAAPSITQGISQNASNVATAGAGSTINQANYQNAYQNVTWNQQNYFTTYKPTMTVTSQQVTTLTTTSQQFLTGYVGAREFIMPLTDLRTFVTQSNPNIVIVDVSTVTTSTIASQFPGALRIPLPNLVASLNQIPAGKTVVVVSDNDIDSAVAMTLLRMYGYNAWLAQMGTCGWAVPGVTATAGVTGYAGPTSTYVTPAPGYVATTGTTTGYTATTGY